MSSCFCLFRAEKLDKLGPDSRKIHKPGCNTTCQSKWGPISLTNKILFCFLLLDTISIVLTIICEDYRFINQVYFLDTCTYSNVEVCPFLWETSAPILSNPFLAQSITSNFNPTSHNLAFSVYIVNLRFLFVIIECPANSKIDQD